MIFRTAFPLGYLFIFIFLLAAFTGGLATLAAGVFKKSKVKVVTGAVMSLSVVLLVLASVSFESKLDFNPIIIADDQVIGTWTDVQSKSLTLRADYSFVYTNGSNSSEGRWTRCACDLDLGGPMAMRFIEYEAELRLLADPPGDPDMWDGDLGLRKTMETTLRGAKTIR